MIFPFLRGLVSLSRAPITYFLVLLNLLVFAVTYESFMSADSKMDAVLDDESFLETQGFAFASMILREPMKFSPMLQAMAERSLAVDRDATRMLGNLAFRNGDFVSRASTFDFGGDQLALEKWKEKFQKFEELKKVHPSFLWGLSDQSTGFLQWVSYQFAHSGWMHLFWNMVFLLIFGCYVETTLGASFVMLSYLGGGLAGAWAFSFMSGISSSPLVGASASVSGLIGVVAFAFMRRRETPSPAVSSPLPSNLAGARVEEKISSKKPIRGRRLKFFYWLLPMQGYFGFIRLPSWVVLVVSLIPDLSGYLSASSDFGSVAYSAHIGGAGFGALIAVALSMGWLVNETRDDADSPSASDDSSSSRAA